MCATLPAAELQEQPKYYMYINSFVVQNRLHYRCFTLHLVATQFGQTKCKYSASRAATIFVQRSASFDCMKEGLVTM